jgi:hypothetical protein
MSDISSTRRFAHNSDSVLVSHEEVDMFLNPFKHHSLVVEPCVGHSIPLEGRSGEEAECAQAVVPSYEDNAF